MTDFSIPNIWCLNLDVSDEKIKQFSQYLDSKALFKASSFKTLLLQKRFLATRGYVREILGNILNVDPSKLEFTYGPYKKPYVKVSSSEQISFNISHSQNILMFGVTKNCEIGVDIEIYKNIPNVLELAELFYKHSESKIVAQQQSAEQQNLTFFRFWVSKEATVKAIGDGIFFGLESIIFSLKDKIKFERIEREGFSIDEFCLYEFNLNHLINAGLPIPLEHLTASAVVTYKSYHRTLNEKPIF